MPHEIRLLFQDQETGRLYKGICDDEGRIAFLEIAQTEPELGDFVVPLSRSGVMVGVSQGREVLYPAGEHPEIPPHD